MNDNTNSADRIFVTAGALRALQKTRGWVRFLGVIAVIGAVFCGIGLLAAIALLASKGLAGLPLLIETAIFLAITILLAVFWLKYSGALKNMSDNNENLAATLDEALVRQRKLWALQGVVLAVLLLFGIAFWIAALYIHLY